MEQAPDQIEVVDNPAQRRFEVRVDGVLAGFADYRRRDDRIIFTHTEVDDAFAGRGVGTSLARGALATVRKRKEKLVPLCPFIASYVRRHDEYSDLVDVDLTAALRRGSQSSR